MNLAGFLGQRIYSILVSSLWPSLLGLRDFTAACVVSLGLLYHHTSPFLRVKIRRHQKHWQEILRGQPWPQLHFLSSSITGSITGSLFSSLMWPIVRTLSFNRHLRIQKTQAYHFNINNRSTMAHRVKTHDFHFSGKKSTISSWIKVSLGAAPEHISRNVPSGRHLDFEDYMKK